MIAYVVSLEQDGQSFGIKLIPCTVKCENFNLEFRIKAVSNCRFKHSRSRLTARRPRDLEYRLSLLNSEIRLIVDNTDWPMVIISIQSETFSMPQLLSCSCV